MEKSYLQQIKGNLLDSKETYIAQQCNCCTSEGKGLSLHLFKKFPYANSYKKRVRSDKSTHHKPGTIEVYKNIINMYAQYYPSLGKYVSDSNQMRIQWFKECLNQIKQIDNIQNKTIAMPYKIGCGLAGGDWQIYEKMLEEFANSEKIHIVLYNFE